MIALITHYRETSELAKTLSYRPEPNQLKERAESDHLRRLIAANTDKFIGRFAPEKAKDPGFVTSSEVIHRELSPNVQRKQEVLIDALALMSGWFAEIGQALMAQMTPAFPGVDLLRFLPNRIFTCIGWTREVVVMKELPKALKDLCKENLVGSRVRVRVDDVVNKLVQLGKIDTGEVPTINYANFVTTCFRNDSRFTKLDGREFYIQFPESFQSIMTEGFDIYF